MKKLFIKFAGLVVTSAIVLSSSGLVLANEVENTGDDVVTATEEPAEAVQDEKTETPEDENAPAPADNPSNEETESNGNSGAQDKGSGDNSDSSKPDAGKNGESQTEITITQEVNVDYANNNDELAESYINHVFGLDSSKTSTKKAAKRAYDPSTGFSPVNKFIYSNLKEHFAKIAAGNETSTEIELSITDFDFTYRVSDLVTDTNDLQTAATVAVDRSGVDFEAIFHALLNSSPYDLYWFDKTQKGSASCSYSFSFLSDSNNNLYIRVAKVTTKFLVAEEYRDNNNSYVVSTSFSATVETAHNNAITIVSTNKDLDDYKKLEAYKDAICDLVDYNHAAADNNDTPYGNPWQLIWVFDGNDSTKVVCEGYSKAFQYLCENTDFSSNEIYTVCVSGDVVLRSNTGSVTGPHMWNVVHMEDGKNYLVDVTNCDTGFYLFMKGYVSTLSNGYVVSNGRGQNNDYPYKTTSLTPALASSDYVYTEPAKVERTSIALNDLIGINFKLVLPDDFLDDSDAYVEVNGTVCQIGNKDSNGRYVVTYSVPVVEIEKELVLKLYKGDGTLYPLLNKSGSNVTNDGFAYSVAEYITEANAAGSGVSDATITVLKRLADFSKKSQLYFNPSANVGSYSDIAGDINNVTVSDFKSYKFVESYAANPGIKRSGSSLALETATEINHKFVLDSGKKITDYKFYVNNTLVTTSSTGNYRLWYDTSAKKYVLTIKGIAASHLQDVYKIVVTDNSNNEVYRLENYSALSYAYAVFDKASNDSVFAQSKASLISLLKAMYLYNQDAIVRFNT